MNVWILRADEFDNDEGEYVFGVYATRPLAEDAFAEHLRTEEEGKRVVREEDLSAGDTTTIVRWVSSGKDDDTFEADTWTLEERPVQGL